MKDKWKWLNDTCLAFATPRVMLLSQRPHLNNITDKVKLYVIINSQSPIGVVASKGCEGGQEGFTQVYW